MRIELITDPDHLYGWDQLADDVNQPRAGPAMIAAWARHMMDRDAELRVWFAIEGTQVVGVLPLVAESMPRGRERLLPPAATFMYGSIPVADPRREREIAAALVGACTTASTLVDVVGLDAMPPDSPWTDAFNNALSGPRWVAVDPIRHISSYVDLKGGVEQWLGRRDSKFKREVRRRARIQEAEGFRLRSTSEPEEIVTRLPAVHSLYAQRQQERGGAGYRFDETMIAAIREVLTRAPAGRIRLVTIERDDVIIAMQMELHAGHRTSAWMTGFDPAWGRLGPGKAVLVGSLAASAAAGDKIFDLGGGDELYKNDFVDGGYQLEDRLWCSPRMARLLGPRPSPLEEPSSSPVSSATL